VKYKELSKKDKRYFWIGTTFAVIYVVVALCVGWTIVTHLIHQEYLEASNLFAIFLMCHFMSKAGRRKREIKKLQQELAEQKVIFEKTAVKVAREAFQRGIDFQRKVFLHAMQKMRQN
jgi:hypothetical protein